MVSHVHLMFGPLKGWASAGGYMKPGSDGGSSVRLVFDDFWIAGNTPTPRDAPSDEDAGAFDQFTRALGRAFFFEGLADFPVDYVDMNAGLVSFRFTAFDSCIIAQRAPKGQGPQPCAV